MQIDVLALYNLMYLFYILTLKKKVIWEAAEANSWSQTYFFSFLMDSIYLFS